MNQYAVTITFKHDDEEVGATQLSFDVLPDFVFYAATIATFLMVIILVLKLMRDMDGDASSGGEATENSGLLCPKEEGLFSSYGTNEEDLESGRSGSCSTTSASDDELYDGKICVICYDDPRNCFFIPCGHCVSCNTCAHRIMSEETKSCPICRAFINEVQKCRIF